MIRSNSTLMAALVLFASLAMASTYGAASLTATPTSLAGVLVGTTTTQTITLSGGTPNYNISVSFVSGGQTGLTSSNIATDRANGTITLSGTPTGAGVFSFKLNATDRFGKTLPTTTFSLAVFQFTPTTLTQGVAGAPTNQTITFSGGKTPYSLSITNFADVGTGLTTGNITTGNTTVTLSGTPSVGTASFTVVAADATGATVSQGFSFTAYPALTISPAPGALPATTAGTPLSTSTHTISIANGTKPYTSITVSSFNPRTTGLSRFGNVSIDTSAGTVTLNGTPSGAGTLTFNVNVTDSVGVTLTNQAYSMVVNPALAISPTSLPETDVGIAYNKTLTVASTTGTQPYTITIPNFDAGTTDFTLAGNIAVDNAAGTVTVSGTPTSTGTVSFTVHVVDAVGATLDASYTVMINSLLSIAPASLADTTQGVNTTRKITVSNGAKPYSKFTIANINAGTTHLSFFDFSGSASTGVITMNGAYAQGTATFDVVVTDGAGQTLPGGKKTYTLNVNPPISIQPTRLNGTNVGVATNQTLLVTGGTTPYTTVTVKNIIPGTTAGLDINSFTIDPVAGTVNLTGTPTAAGLFTFDVTATDTAGATSTSTYRISVFKFTPVELSPLTLETPTNQVLQITGGLTPYRSIIVSPVNSGGTGLSEANLPIITGNGTVTLTGTPTGTGTLTFNVTVTDARGATFLTTHSVKVNPVATFAPTSLTGATAGTATNQTITVSNGTLPYAALDVAWFDDGGTGLSTGAFTADVSAGTLTLKGTPLAAGSASFTVNVTDANGSVQSKTYTLTVNPAISITTLSLQDWTINKTGYTQNVLATGGTGALTFSAPAVDIPPGLTFTSAGNLTGTPSADGTFTFTVTAADTVGATATQLYTLVTNPAIVLTLPSLAAWTIDIPGYSQALTTTGGTGTLTFTTSDALPDGLALSADGVISGTPTTQGLFSFTVVATDSVGATGSALYSITINGPLSVTTTTLPDWTINFAGYGQSLTTAGGTDAKTFAVTTGSLPKGLHLNGSSGSITGTPCVADTYNFTVTATDTVGATATQMFSITINAAVQITTTALPSWTIDAPNYEGLLSVSGGTSYKTFSLTSGALPNALALNTITGAITGTPTVTGTFNFTITATDTVGATGTQDLSIVINPAVTITTLILPDWTVDTANYSQTFVADDGTGTKTFAISTGNLPDGLNLDGSTGVISGTPSVADTFTFGITATDSVGGTGSQAYTVIINVPVSVTTTTLASWTVDIDGYCQPVAASGGTGAKTFAVTEGSLPTGLCLHGKSGKITGTPTVADTFEFTVTATDTVGATATQDLSITINPPVSITTTSLPCWTIDVPGYSSTVSATDGTGAKTFAVTNGALPTDLILNSTTGAITGTPSVEGTFDFTITATDTLGATGTQDLSIVINPAVNITLLTLPNWTLNVPNYSQTLVANDGTGKKKFTVTSGALPDGLSLNCKTGSITGTPSVEGTFDFTITATDKVGGTGTEDFTVVINPAVTITSTLTNWTINKSGYSQTVTTTGGTGAKTFALTSGALPTGLSLDASSGIVSGTPMVANTFNFTITATDKVGGTGAKPYAVTVNAAVTINTTSLVAWTANYGGYSQTIAATGGTGAITFTTVNANLPIGLTLSSAGVLSGTPTAAGSSTFVVTSTDSVGATGTASYTISIAPAIAITTGTTLPNGILALAYSQQLAATGGTGTLTFTSGTLPAGLTLSTTGVLSGTPTAVASNATINVTVTDSVGATATGALTISIIGNPPVFSSVTVTPSNAVVGQTVTVTALGVTTDDGQPAIITIDFADGSTPIVGNTATHVYSANGIYTIKVTATSAVSGLFATFTEPINIGFSITGSTIVIGKSGQTVKSGFGGKYTVNFGTPSKSIANGRIVHLIVPPTLTQNDLTGQNGTLTVGSGPLAATYPFALTSKGNAKTAQLTGIAIAIKNKTAQFTTKGDARLAAYAQSIGVLNTVKAVTVLVPVTIEIPGKVFIYVQLEILFKNPTGKTAAGKLTQ